MNIPRALSVLRHIMAAIVILVGLMTVSAWAAGKPYLTGEIAYNINMKANTGIGFLLIGLSMFLTRIDTRSSRPPIALGLAVCVFLLGLLTLSQHLFGWDLGIDQFFFKEAPGEVATTSPNRMGPIAATSFTVCGLALILLNQPGRLRAHRSDIASGLVLFTGALALLPILGYLYGAQALFGIARLTGIALPTALSFLIVSVGILCACEDGRVVRLIVAPTAGGMLIRRLLLPALLLPPVLGYLRTVGESAGYFDTAFGRALLILSIMLVFSTIVWWSGLVLDRVDIARGYVSERLGAIVESSDDAIISKKLDGTITTWNQAAEELFGYTAEEMIGQNIRRIIPRERLEEEESIISRITQGERVAHFQTERIGKDGKRVSLSLTISPVKDITGKIIGASKIARDISAFKQREADREEALAAEHAARKTAEQAGRMKDEFLATLSHELRTPMSAILGWSQLLKREPSGSGNLQQGLEVIERNARVQTQLIEDLLDMSAIISGKVRLNIQSIDPVGFIEAALETVRPASEAKGIRIEKLLDPAAGPIFGDPNRMQQIVWNLVSNAIKFTPRGGKVQVVLQRVNSHIEIAVADTGIGIKTEFLPHVFERFRQADASTSRKHGGLGLGLAIVRHLVELHGGTIVAASPGEGSGTTFTVNLPLSVVHREDPGAPRAHPRTQAEPGAFRSLDLSKVKVLVVDDEPDARQLIRRILEECQANVITASNAAEAVASVESERPDVLVSDIGMPETDGYELLKRVRALGRTRGGKIPAIALTAFARSEDRTRALQAGFQVHVSKPVEPSELIATVASVSGWADENRPETSLRP